MTPTFKDVLFTATFHHPDGIDGTSVETVTVTARAGSDGQVTVAPITTCGPNGLNITSPEDAPLVAHDLTTTVTSMVTRMLKENQK